MRVRALHEWEVSVAQAREMQFSLAKQVSTENIVVNPRLIAGIDPGKEEGSESVVYVLEKHQGQSVLKEPIWKPRLFMKVDEKGNFIEKAKNASFKEVIEELVWALENRVGYAMRQMRAKKKEMEEVNGQG